MFMAVSYLSILLCQGVSLWIVGMPGSGKTTLGKMLAEGLGYRWLDLDVFLEEVSKVVLVQRMMKVLDPILKPFIVGLSCRLLVRRPHRYLSRRGSKHGGNRRPST